MKEYQQEIKDALNNIFTYTGTDLKWVKDGNVQTYLEWLIKNCKRIRETKE